MQFLTTLREQEQQAATKAAEAEAKRQADIHGKRQRYGQLIRQAIIDGDLDEVTAPKFHRLVAELGIDAATVESHVAAIRRADELEGAAQSVEALEQAREGVKVKITELRIAHRDYERGERVRLRDHTWDGTASVGVIDATEVAIGQSNVKTIREISSLDSLSANLSEQLRTARAAIDERNTLLSRFPFLFPEGGAL
ncbi:hypothetical protein [Humisphaera borealis]|uniref:Uncharacterized protein n=1 Tax=Humisphaera borealis TaxID=2807512 RepID=A0A7M2X2T4_9BACT|nr:hypothetical protein [Humisphaera borealis]QOV91070.1 hypothetical protein IPV69_06840 [Humisphaera borealis]